MKVNIITIAYNLPEGTQKLVETALLDADKHDISFQLFLHSKHQATVEMCNSLHQKYPVIYYPYGENRGLANSWNEGIIAAFAEMNGIDVLILANDDVYFAAGDIDKIAKRAIEKRDNYMISCSGFNKAHGKVIPSLGYSCFALNPIAYERIGMFDQNIFPIYTEDQDHHRRAHLMSMVEENCADTECYHGGSGAINKDPMLARQNIITQGKNRRYLFAKWGSETLEGGYKTPFNNPKFNCYINPEVRHNPYGEGYDRTDQRIVRF